MFRSFDVSSHSSSDGWPICVQEVQEESVSLVVPNAQEGLVDESTHLLLLSLVKELGHLRADGQNTQYISHHMTCNVNSRKKKHFRGNKHTVEQHLLREKATA